MIKPLFNNLNINTKRHSFLIGDSAYNTKNKRFVKYNNNMVTNIQLIFPYKKNQKDKLNDAIKSGKTLTAMERKIQTKRKMNKKKEEFKLLPKEKQNEILLEYIKLKEEFPYIEDAIKNNINRKILKEKLDNKKIVVIDPGKRAPLYMMGERKPEENAEENAEVIIEKRKIGKREMGKREKKFEDKIFMNYTNRRRIKELKRLKYGNLRENMKKRIHIENKTAKEIETELTVFNTKTNDTKRFIEYVGKKLEVNKRLNNFNKINYFRKLKWYSYLNKRRHEDRLLDEIEKTFGRDIIIVIGDWNDTGKIKYMSTPNIGLRRLLAERFIVLLIDEYRTSLLHYKHEIECEKMKITIKKKYIQF